ncbi:MAG TPA: hypothetical protein VFX49_02615 [Chloroflexota bacterium]|nr:hypothetical protein [Chloroflexota bacterium]
MTVTPGPTRTPLAEGERPGWGCGDENHEHIGPPGNPDAESPCDNAHGGDEDDGGDDAAVMGQSRGQDKPSKHEDED